jgi:hypothetical protein
MLDNPKTVVQIRWKTLKTLNSSLSLTHSDAKAQTTTTENGKLQCQQKRRQT